jgi:NAD(P)H-flavin reductase
MFGSTRLLLLYVMNLQPGQFVACIYDDQWWPASIVEICTDNNDAKISFMHPHGPATIFFGRQR